MFFAYLEDREIVTPAYFASVSQKSAVSLSTLLETGSVDLFRSFFRTLHKDFNGDLFVAPCAFEPMAMSWRGFALGVKKWRNRASSGSTATTSAMFPLNSQVPSTIAFSVNATLRRRRLTGQHIARQTGVSAATVSRLLKRAVLSRLKNIEPAQPVRRYEREKPGEMIHIDVKKLGRFERVGHRITGDRVGQSNSRGVGWEFVHFYRRRLARRLLAGLAGREKESAIAFLLSSLIMPSRAAAQQLRHGLTRDNSLLPDPTEMVDK